jgi:cystathionine beta-lyase
MGSVSANERCWRQLWDDAALLGQTVSPDDAYQALKGLRTAAARIRMIEDHARQVMNWLQQRPEVERVLYPPLESDPAHQLWKRDFKGGNGLFSIGLTADIDQAAVFRFIDALQLFGIGASWGGFESLVLTYPRVPGWTGNRLIRFHVGLEDPADLIADLERGFKAMAAA